jgi:hypothetical protein
MLRVLITSARDSVEIPARFSATNTPMPYRASVIPAASPAGPAPTTSTCA